MGKLKNKNKGSQKQMRIYANAKKCILNKLLSDELDWLCPISNDDFHERQLNNCEIRKRLKLDSSDFGFWPSRQPQWDGIAIGRSGTLYLFEAKSHKGEIQGSYKKKSSMAQIQLAIDDVIDFLLDSNLDSDTKKYWYKRYYQIANRIVFKVKMQQFYEAQKTDAYNNVVLVFLNFVNDKSWEKQKKMVKSPKEWENHYDKVFAKMGINKALLEKRNILIKCIDAINSEELLLTNDEIFNNV